MIAPARAPLPAAIAQARNAAGASVRTVEAMVGMGGERYGRRYRIIPWAATREPASYEKDGNRYAWTARSASR